MTLPNLLLVRTGILMPSKVLDFVRDRIKVSVSF